MMSGMMISVAVGVLAVVVCGTGIRRFLMMKSAAVKVKNEDKHKQQLPGKNPHAKWI